MIMARSSSARRRPRPVPSSASGWTGIFARRLATCARAPARMRGRRRRAARPDATREGWAMRRRGIDRRPGGAAAAARGRFGGVAVAAGTRRDARGTWGRMRSDSGTISGHRNQQFHRGGCAVAASIGAPAVPRRRRGDDSAGSNSRRGSAGTFRGRGGAREAMAAPLTAIAGNNSNQLKLLNPYFERPSTNSYVETYHASRISTFFNPRDLPPYWPGIAPDPIPLQTQPGMGQGDHWPSLNTPIAAVRRRQPSW